MSSAGVFVTGTDTNVGKTRASVALLRAHRKLDRRAIGMKPVASGCRATDAGLRNDDAEALIAFSDPRPAYSACNPIALRDAIAPHLAARHAGIEIALPRIVDAYRTLERMCDRVVVEGAGGWMVPLSPQSMQADLVRALGLPVVLVVGLRLGCINHALSSVRAIDADDCTLVGWIANRIDPAMAVADENIETLRTRIAAPLFGVLSHGRETRDEEIATLATALRPL